MPTDIVHTVRKTDDDDGDDQDRSFVLLRVTRAATGSLDWQLASCDGDAIYTLRLHQRTLKSARAPAFRGDDATWIALLKWVVFRDPDATIDPTRDLALVAQTSKDEHIILIRETLPGNITQRLGSLTLKYSEEASNNADLFAWSQAAAQQSLSQHQVHLELSATLERANSDNDRLRQALQDLTDAKAKHERQLLEKARRLINSKKLKIREQQRLLAGAKIDVPTSTSNAKEHRPAPSRKGKRAAAEIASKPVTMSTLETGMEADTDDEGFETDSDRGIETPGSGHDDADDAEDADDGDDAVSSRCTQVQEPPGDTEPSNVGLPQRRQLPFNGKKSGAPQGDAETDEADTEDEDEL